MAILVTPQTGATSPASSSPFPGLDNGQFLIYGFFTLVASGNYVAGGDPFTFGGVTDLLKTAYAPLNLSIASQSSAGFSGFYYAYRPGGIGMLATLTNGRMQVFQSGNNANPLSELAAGAYPAGVLADTIVASGCFVRQ